MDKVEQQAFELAASKERGGTRAGFAARTHVYRIATVRVFLDWGDPSALNGGVATRVIWLEPNMKTLHENYVKLGFALALLILGGIGLLSFWSLTGFIETSHWVAHTHQVIEKLQDLETELTDVESSERGYVLGGQDFYLDPYYVAVKEVDRTLEDLRKLTAENARQQRRIAAVKPLIAEKLAYHRRMIELRKRQGLAHGLQVFATGKGYQLMDEIRIEINNMGADEKRLLAERSAAAGARAGKLRHVLLIAAIASLSMLVLVYIDLNREIARRKRSELEIRRLNEDLERRVADRTAKLAIANEQLAVRNQEVERANRLKSEFLARMSHEFRTPLNAIVGFSDLLAEEAEEPLNDTYKDFVAHIQEGARHLVELINDILDLSRIEAGRLELHHENVPVAEALLEVLSVIKPLAQTKGIQIDNQVSDGLVVPADRTRFKQVLYNLLSNAVKFTPEGGKVRTEAFPKDGSVCFVVGDTGVGIPPEEHEAIFDEFHQVGATTKGVKEGTGLGLAITRRLIRQHGGEIRVESEPGEGSRFYFTLPLERP